MASPLSLAEDDAVPCGVEGMAAAAASGAKSKQSGRPLKGSPTSSRPP